MKDYKRLTKWSELGTLHVFDINGKEIPLCDVSPIDTDNLIGRLAELEDKIEAGTLVEVPKGAVVLTPEERAEEMRLCNEERTQAVIEFVDEFKSRYFFMMATYMKNPIYQCTEAELDRLVKEWRNRYETD